MSTTITEIQKKALLFIKEVQVHNPDPWNFKASEREELVNQFREHLGDFWPDDEKERAYHAYSVANSVYVQGWPQKAEMERCRALVKWAVGTAEEFDMLKRILLDEPEPAESERERQVRTWVEEDGARDTLLAEIDEAIEEITELRQDVVRAEEDESTADVGVNLTEFVERAAGLRQTFTDHGGFAFPEAYDEGGE